MLTNEGIKALVEFTDRFDVPIVTRSMFGEKLERLNELLLQWKDDPSLENQSQIIDEFVSKQSRDVDL